MSFYLCGGFTHFVLRTETKHITAHDLNTITAVNRQLNTITTVRRQLNVILAVIRQTLNLKLDS
jgi:hypothetical protein